MEFDIKTVPTLIAVVTAIVSLYFTFMPKAPDRLKKNLELLKLSREVEVNFLPLERVVDAQIHEAYTKSKLSRFEKIEIFWFRILVSLAISLMLFAALGGVASVIVSLTPLGWSTDTIMENFLYLGLAFGFYGGLIYSGDEVKLQNKELVELALKRREEDHSILKQKTNEN